MDPLSDALLPKPAGTIVRSLARVAPGIATTRDQILAFAAAWRETTLETIGSDHPALVVFGDSIGQGIGATDPSHAYAAAVAERAGEILGYPVGLVNLTRSGAKIADVLTTQLDAYASIDHSRIIGGMCTVGSNDLVWSPRIGAVAKRMVELVEALPDGVAIATVPDVGSLGAKRVNRRIRAASTEHGRPLADVAAQLRSWRGLRASDGFHPNDAGYQLWADVFLTTLLRSGMRQRAEAAAETDPIDPHLAATNN